MPSPIYVYGYKIIKSSKESMMKARLKRLIYFVFRLMAIKKNRVLIFSYYGGNYGGSPKYLSEYFVKNAPELEVVWAFTEPEKYADIKEICPVKYSSLKYYYYLSTSAFIITNYRMTTEFVKRKEQRYIQTWHSSLRLKMIEKDAEGTLPKHYIEMAKILRRLTCFWLEIKRAGKYLNALFGTTVLI